jgi:hypothetical protein
MTSTLAILALLMIAPLTVSPASAAAPLTQAGFASQTGDFIGQGENYSFSSVTYNGLRGDYPTFTVSNGSDSFDVWIAAPAGQPLTPGTYTGAQRFDFRAPGTPGLDVFGDGRGCDTVSGSFTVFDATYDSSGDVLTFAAQFTDHCEGDAPALYGYLSYNSTATMSPWLVSSNPSSSVQFPDTRVGTGSDAESQTLTNLGSDMPINEANFAGPAADDFIGEHDCGASLALGQSCQLELAFIPGTIGTRTATLDFGATGGSAVSLALSGTGTAGYFVADADGDLFPFGDGASYGDMSNSNLNAPIVSMAATPDGYGYWLLGADGGIFSFGDAQFYGSTGSIRLNRPVVAMSATIDGGGYWFVATDGGVFSYGDAQFYGSTGSLHLNKPIVGMAPTPDGGGYWLVASDGGIFSFGDAQFYGSTGGIRLNQPIVGMAPTPDGGGYWLVASDGGIFSFGDAQFHGSTGSTRLSQPILGIAPTWDGQGYWLVGRDGGVFNFGDAPFYGSAAGSASGGAVAIAPTAPPTLQAYLDIPAVRKHALPNHSGWVDIGST